MIQDNIPCCPKCYKQRSDTLDELYDDIDDRTYYILKCEHCGAVYYTQPRIEVIYTSLFREDMPEIVDCISDEYLEEDEDE